jgi:nucleotide-binding universal stress UspA family protein
MDDGPILICVDGSASARRAIKEAAELLGPRRAVVLEDMNRADALDRAREGTQLARDAGFEAEARAMVAAPTWQGIVEVATEIDADVIVMGSRGLTGIRELLDGGISHQVAEHAGRPVLIVPAPEES